MAKELKGVNLGAMFQIDMVPGADGAPSVDPKDLCAKCNGRGNFLSHKGKVVGPCFKCDGTGLANPNMGKVVKPGDCPKCFGSGEWRPNHPCFACNGTGKEVVKSAAVDVDVSAITACFATAHGNGIKTPKLRLGDFIFSRAPDHGTNAGAVYVKSKLDHAYLGKVADGKFHAAKVCDDPTKAAVVAVASDPLNSAKAYGQKFGSCSVCGRTLTQTKWIEAGIGPVCAEKFGW